MLEGLPNMPGLVCQTVVIWLLDILIGITDKHREFYILLQALLTKFVSTLHIPAYTGWVHTAQAIYISGT